MTRKKSGSKKKTSGAKSSTSPAAQTASAPATASPESRTFALSVVGPAPFWNAVHDDECPAELDVGLEITPTPQSASGAVAASAVVDLLKWFAKGVAAVEACTARLEFAASLSKDERATVHSAIASAGLSVVLESCSEGVGEERKLTVYKKGAAPAKEPPSPELLERAAALYKWAREAGLMSYSRDEIAEQLAAAADGSGLAAPLAALWASRSAEQADVAALTKLVEADDVAGVAAMLKSKPGLANTVDSVTGQPPLHAAARLGSTAALRALAAAGARLEDKDAHGRTALQVARTFEQCDAEAALLQLGVHDPEAGRFPLNKAVVELGVKAAGIVHSVAEAVSEVGARAAAAVEAAVEPKAVEEAKAEESRVEAKEAQEPAVAEAPSKVEAAAKAAAAEPKPAEAAATKPAVAEVAPQEAVRSPTPAAAAAIVAPPEAPVTPDPDAKGPPATAATTTAVVEEEPTAETATAEPVEAADGASSVKSPSALTPVTSVTLPAVAEAAASAAVAAADRVVVNVKTMVSEGRAWVSGHGGFGLYAGATAIVAGLAMTLLAVSRRR